MISKKNCYKVILISPNDVDKEKKAIKKIINETNEIFKNSNKILELYTWDVDVSASYSLEGPQRLIDSDLKIENSDIVIALFYKRFGSPVMDSKSGTEHEIKLAIDSFRKKGTPIIKIYFKKPLVNLDDLDESDLTQYKLLQEFKKRASKKFFTKQFKFTNELESILRKELSKFLIIKEKNRQELLQESFREIRNNQIEDDKELDFNEEIIEEDSDFEKGVLDYTVEGEDAMLAIKDSMKRMTKHSKTYANNIELIIKNTQKPLAVRAQRAISFRVATETDKLSVKLYIEQPILKNSFESFYESVIGLIHLTKMEKYNNKKDILAFKEIIEKFRDSTGKLIKTLKVVLEQSKSFLGISRNLNKSQYKYEKVTNILIDNISLGKLICDKIIELLNEKYYL